MIDPKLELLKCFIPERYWQINQLHLTMKLAKKSFLLTAALTTAFNVAHVHAQNGLATPYAAGDLLINFRVNNAGSPGANDYTMDLGNVSTFITAHSGQQFQITDFSAVSSALGGNLNNVFWSAAATDGSAAANIWLTSQRGASTDPSTFDSYQLDRKSNLSQGAARNGITSVGNNTSLGSSISPTVVSTPDAANYSYHFFVTDNGTFSYTGAGSALTSGNGYEGVTGSSFSGANVLDFYALPSGSGKGTYLGYFELTSSGSLVWFDQASAVPEPSALGLFAMGCVFLVFRARSKVSH